MSMKQVVLRAHPVGEPRASDFSVETVEMARPGDGQVLLQTRWLSLDPLIRFALDEKILTGRARVNLGEPIYGGSVSNVVESRHADFAVGDVVEGRTGWREFAAVDPKLTPLRKIDPGLAPVTTALGVLGMPGQTAHACMIGIGRVAAARPW
jgi:NADPH-dependent curcumin reductase CurA